MIRTKECFSRAPSFPSKHSSPWVAVWQLAFVLVAATCFSSGVWAQLPTCPNTPPCDHSSCGFNTCATPAQPPPSSYWGALQPADPACTALPSTRDSTHFNTNGAGGLYSAVPWATAVDIRNNMAYEATGYGLAVWDIGTNPASPNLLGKWGFTQLGEIYTPIIDVSVPNTPAGTSPTVAMIGGGQSQGAFVLDVSVPTAPKESYNLQNINAPQVYSAVLGGKDYGFVAASASGLFVL